MREVDTDKHELVIRDAKLCKVDESGECLTDNRGNVILYDMEALNGHYFEEFKITGESLHVSV